MAITITANTTGSAVPLSIDWQAGQATDPDADAPIATLSSDLTTGEVNAAGVTSDPPLYSISGLPGLVAPGGSGLNGVIMADGALLAATTTSEGSGYVDGAYNGVALVSSTGTGSGATMDIQWLGGSIAFIVFEDPGTGYAVGDQLTVAAADVGGSGSGFLLTVAQVY